MTNMSERDELVGRMDRPELFRLELPPGHPGQRPFAIFGASLDQVASDMEKLKPLLARVRAGEPLTVDEVSQLATFLGALSSSGDHMMRSTMMLNDAVMQALFLATGE